MISPDHPRHKRVVEELEMSLSVINRHIAADSLLSLPADLAVTLLSVQRYLTCLFEALKLHPEFVCGVVFRYLWEKEDRE